MVGSFWIACCLLPTARELEDRIKAAAVKTVQRAKFDAVDSILDGDASDTANPSEPASKRREAAGEEQPCGTVNRHEVSHIYFLTNSGFFFIRSPRVEFGISGWIRSAISI